MLQNVNLYLPEFRKKQDWLQVTRMLQLAGLLVAVLTLVSAYGYWQTVRLEAELAELEAARVQAVAATNALIDRYGTQTEDSTLLANIRALEDNVQSKEALLEFLDGRELGNSTGLSEYLADLSRFHIRGLSLTDVNLTRGGRSIQISGQVLQTDLVPLYLQNLSRGSSYASTRFETLQIREVQADVSGSMPTVWQFQVNSLNE
jgi:hypothetical protein